MGAGRGLVKWGRMGCLVMFLAVKCGFFVENTPVRLGRSVGQVTPRVAATNDDSTLSKIACIEAGYFHDPYLGLLAGEAARMRGRRKGRRCALIRMGYTIRVKVMEAIIRRHIHHFLTLGFKNIQVISLGAGSDSTYFRISQPSQRESTVPSYPHHLTPSNLTWLDVDLPDVIRGKLRAISESPLLKSLVDNGTHRYRAVGVDFRQIQENMPFITGLDLEAPTIVVAECALQYLEPGICARLLRWTSDHLKKAVIASYDQIATPYDVFSRKMTTALSKKGSPLLGLKSYATPSQLLKRLTQNGFECPKYVGLIGDACCDWLGVQWAEENLGQKELFDEYEDFDLHLCHYAITIAATSPTLTATPALIRQLTPSLPQLETQKVTPYTQANPDIPTSIPTLTLRGVKLASRIGFALSFHPNMTGKGLGFPVCVLEGGFMEGKRASKGVWLGGEIREVREVGGGGNRIGGRGGWVGGMGCVVWGGRRKPGDLCDAPPLLLSPSSTTWQPLLPSPLNPPTPADITPRHRHCFEYFNRIDDTYISLVFGGVGPEGIPLSDWHVLETSRRSSGYHYRWLPVRVEGDSPPGLFSASLVAHKALASAFLAHGNSSDRVVGFGMLVGGRQGKLLAGQFP
ncbi:hypothetical protein AAMO2058_000428000 [Amorphochlora amoebiformis]